MAEKQVVRGSESHLREDLKKAKDQLRALEEEKSRILDELREMKKVAEDANLRLSEALMAQQQVKESWETQKICVNDLEQASVESAQKSDQAWQLEFEALQRKHADTLSSITEELDQVNKELLLATKAKNNALKESENAKIAAEANAKKVKDLSTELHSLKGLLESGNAFWSVHKNALNNSDGESDSRKVNGLAIPSNSGIEFLKLELKKRKDLEAKLAERDALIEELKLVLNDARESESQTADLLSESQMQIKKLELELEKAKESETKTFESLIFQTKQLEETKIFLEEAKLKISSLHENIESMEVSFGLISRDPNVSHRCLETAKLDMHSAEEIVEALETKLQIAKEHLVDAREREELALSNARSFAEEITQLRNDLKLATQAEEKSKRAMDDLALALVEIMTEANQVKEKLASTEFELDSARRETEQTKTILKSTEVKFQALLDEARKEISQAQEAAERLKLEVEESHTNWNGKEVGFVHCMRMTEEEIADAKEENDMLIESLKEAEIAAKMAREENTRLRDILKQALNEATVSKEAAEIARNENSQLKDSLLEIENELIRIAQENELLKNNEATFLEISKESKQKLTTTSATTSLTNSGLQVPMSGKAMEDDDEVSESPSEQSKQQQFLEQELQNQRTKNGYNDFIEGLDLFKGSIFDDMADSPHQHDMFASTNGKWEQKATSIPTKDREIVRSDFFIHMGRNQFNEMDGDGGSEASHRKKKALLRRFGDLLRRRSFYAK